MKSLAIVLVGFSLIFYSFGGYYSKVWSIKPSISLAISVFVLYGISGTLWLQALREHGQLSALSAAWSSLSLIICILIGCYVFGEQLENRQVIGIILAFIATFLVF